MPDDPTSPGPDPMCVDGNAMAWLEALVAHQPPPDGRPGIMYMLAGGSDASNTDPYASGPKADNHWIATGAHVMMVGAKGTLQGYPRSADPNTSGALRDVARHALRAPDAAGALIRPRASRRSSPDRVAKSSNCRTGSAPAERAGEARTKLGLRLDDRSPESTVNRGQSHPRKNNSVAARYLASLALNGNPPR